MKTTLVYLSSCALDGQGKPDTFLLQELPWLIGHFDRVLLCSYYGVAELTDPAPTRIPVWQPALGEWRAKLRAPLSADLWRSLFQLARGHGLTPVSALKLLLFAVRGRMLANWVRPLLRKDEATTLYSFWMSYDGYAAALLKRENPSLTAVARGHAFDIDPARNPINPYLMKRMMGETLDALYLISEDAKARLAQSVPLAPEKLHVLGMGSAGDAPRSRFPAPMYTDGVFRLVSCSAVLAIKRLPLLIDALSLWQGGRLRWTHIGGGAGEPALRAYAAQKLGERSDIELAFTGTVDPALVQTLYEAQPFDVFVNVSESEGVPVSIMEAMRAGIPIVAPAIGGIPELVGTDCGVLFAPDADAAGVLAALNAIAALPVPRAEAMRAAAQAQWNAQCRSDVLLSRLFPEAASRAATPFTPQPKPTAPSVSPPRGKEASPPWRKKS